LLVKRKYIVGESATGGRESVNNEYRIATGWRERELYPIMSRRERTID